jgi:N-methylhydantoinase A
MADLVRRMSIERGHDPRSVAILAFGGAGPLHVGSFAPDLGVRDVIVPVDAGVFSADGLVRAGWRRVYRTSVLMAAPLDAAPVRKALESLEAAAGIDVAASGRKGSVTLARSLELRYRRQTHSVEVALDDSFDDAALPRAVELFEKRYEEIHGPGTGYRPAGIELTAVRVEATLPGIHEAAPGVGLGAADVHTPLPARRRDVFFDEWCRDVPIHDGATLTPGAVVDGPAIIDWPTTSLVIHPGQAASILPGGHARLTFSAQ